MQLLNGNAGDFQELFSRIYKLEGIASIVIHIG